MIKELQEWFSIFWILIYRFFLVSAVITIVTMMSLECFMLKEYNKFFREQKTLLGNIANIIYIQDEKRTGLEEQLKEQLKKQLEKQKQLEERLKEQLEKQEQLKEQIEEQLEEQKQIIEKSEKRFINHKHNGIYRKALIYQ
jgi:flagellar motility protein MotE (MotC chaperone)